MQRLADVTLALLQWALVVIGLLTVLVTLVSYRTDASYFASLPQVPQTRAATTSSQGSDGWSSASHRG